MPWIVARRTVRSTLRLAWTAAKRLSMERIATAGAVTTPSLGTEPVEVLAAGRGPALSCMLEPPSRQTSTILLSEFARVVGHVVGNLDLARDDVGLGRIDLGLHRRIDELRVVLVERVIDA